MKPISPSIPILKPHNNSKIYSKGKKKSGNWISWGWWKTYWKWMGKQGKRVITFSPLRGNAISRLQVSSSVNTSTSQRNQRSKSATMNAQDSCSQCNHPVIKIMTVLLHDNESEIGDRYTWWTENECDPLPPSTPLLSSTWSMTVGIKATDTGDGGQGPLPCYVYFNTAGMKATGTGDDG